MINFSGDSNNPLMERFSNVLARKANEHGLEFVKQLNILNFDEEKINPYKVITDEIMKLKNLDLIVSVFSKKTNAYSK